MLIVFLHHLKMVIIGYSIFSSAKYLIRMPMVWLLHSLSLRLRKPGRQKGHPRLSQDNFELYPEIFAVGHFIEYQFYRYPGTFYHRFTIKNIRIGLDIFIPVFHRNYFLYKNMVKELFPKKDCMGCHRLFSCSDIFS